MLAAAVLKHRADAVVSYTKGGASARTPTLVGCRRLGRRRHLSPTREVVVVVGAVGRVGRVGNAAGCVWWSCG